MLLIRRVLLFGIILCLVSRFLEGQKVGSRHIRASYSSLTTFPQTLNFLLFRKIVANHNSKYISLYEAAISQDHTTINITLNLARNITADVWLKATIGQRVSKSGESYRDVFTYNVNLCQVMGRGKGISLINFWMNNILRQSNMPRNCPLREVLYLIVVMNELRVA